LKGSGQISGALCVIGKLKPSYFFLIYKENVLLFKYFFPVWKWTSLKLKRLIHYAIVATHLLLVLIQLIIEKKNVCPIQIFNKVKLTPLRSKSKAKKSIATFLYTKFMIAFFTLKFTIELLPIWCSMLNDWSRVVTKRSKVKKIPTDNFCCLSSKKLIIWFSITGPTKFSKSCISRISEPPKNLPRKALHKAQPNEGFFNGSMRLTHKKRYFHTNFVHFFEAVNFHTKKN